MTLPNYTNTKKHRAQHVDIHQSQSIHGARDVSDAGKVRVVVVRCTVVEMRRETRYAPSSVDRCGAYCNEDVE